MRLTLLSKIQWMALTVGVFMSPGMVAAQGPGIIIQSEGQAISAIDLEAELSKAPLEVRQGILDKPDAMGQLAANLLMRRVLARKAEAAALDKQPLNEALLKMARDNVLSDLALRVIDEKAIKSDVELERLASDYYKANTKRFEIPEQVRVSHILVAKGEGARERAEEILKQLKAGADFAQVAKEKSADPGSAQRGGDLGMFGRNRMVKPFDEAAFALKTKGELSGLVETEFGIHILKLEERQEAGVKPYESVRDELREEMRKKAGNEARQQEGKRIMDAAKANNEALLEFIASQKKKQ